MMTTLTKYMKKTTAIAMAAMVLSLPLASVASAHERMLRHRVIPTAMTDTTVMTSMTVTTDMTATTSTTATTDMTATTSVIRTTIT